MKHTSHAAFLWRETVSPICNSKADGATPCQVSDTPFQDSCSYPSYLPSPSATWWWHHAGM